MLDLRETATVLAALLFWREEMCPHGRPIMQPDFDEVEMGHVEPLSAGEINALIHRLRDSAGSADSSPAGP